MRVTILLALLALLAHVVGGVWLAAFAVAVAVWADARRRARVGGAAWTGATRTGAAPSVGQGAVRGAGALALAWAAAWAWRFATAPDAAVRITDTLGGVAGGLPGAALVAASVAVAAMIGGLAGTVGAGLAARTP